MSALRNVAQGFRRVWGMGEEDEYDDQPHQPRRPQSQDAQPDDDDANDQDEAPSERVESRTEIQTVYAPATSQRGRRQNDDAPSEPGSQIRISARSQEAPTPTRGSGGRPLRSVALPMRAREKNIYTLKPKTMDEASLAADYLKTGCAVIVNLEEVDRFVAIRIIDFMSGVCYGLEHQGHAMKLGEIIFLFTPGDFEISSDEVDYGENRDFIFKDVPSATPSAEGAGEGGGERRSWER